MVSYQLKEINDMQLELEKHPMESMPSEVLRSQAHGLFGCAAGADWRLEGKGGRRKCATCAKSIGCSRCTSAWIRVQPSLKATRPTCTRPMKRKMRRRLRKKKVIILGSGPNRIGQGIEFDYCCCHASFALHEDGYETVMINCNPETVSTDYDTSDRLYFEPLTLEDVFAVYDMRLRAAHRSA